MGISACIIAKNEEANIKRCLDSIKNVVDEIIVVDTGSRDNTVEIAKYYGAKIYHHPWEQNFSEVRNLSLEKATEPWILIIDCDEELDKNTISRLKELTKDNTPFEGFGIVITNVIMGKEQYSFSSLRLIRNNKNYRFHGALHEEVEDVILRENGEYSVLSSEVRFLHYGYEEILDLQKEKSDRNISILSTTPIEERDSLYYFHLGNEYSRIKDTTNAIIFYKDSYKLAKKNARHFPQLCHSLMESLYNIENYKEAIVYGNNILKFFPDFKVVHFLKAMCHVKLKQYKQALAHLTIYTDLEEYISKYPNLDYDTLQNINDLKQKLQGLLGV